MWVLIAPGHCLLVTYTLQGIVSGVTGQDEETLYQDTSVRYIFR